MAQKGAGCFPKIAPLGYFCEQSIAGIHCDCGCTERPCDPRQRGFPAYSLHGDKPAAVEADRSDLVGGSLVHLQQ